LKGLDDEIVSISTGVNHSGFVRKSGKVFVWGDNSFGQLGIKLPEGNQVSTPTQITQFDDLKIGKPTKIFCTENSTHVIVKLTS
jgi:alpha-tubulin suppressor-like RCC1 family protein